MAYGQNSPDQLTDRNRDRVALLRYVSQNPAGVRLTVAVHDVLKGVDPTDYYGQPDLSGEAAGSAARYYNGSGYTALDGSDDDYQFAYRFVNDVAQETDLLRLDNPADEENPHGLLVVPTLSLLDLISSGVTETPAEPDELVYDREFCLNLLESNRSRLLRLPDFAKDVLANSLRRYIQRVKDYKLAFDLHLADRTGHQQRRFYKDFATRFTDDGRRDKMFARLQDSLDWGSQNADMGVFATLTTDPKEFDNLLDAIIAINENFHNLTQWLKTSPDSARDTREEGVPAWRPELDTANYQYLPDGQPSGGPPDGPVTGRPGQKLEYVKVLEFTEKGYPHLHVLFFDPPRRESDGMPWLVDKAELSHHWKQGEIVDTYPLQYRNDLDDLEADFNAEEGFVSWYRYGDHDHSQEWVEEQSKHHKQSGQIDFDGRDDVPQQKTAGAYIGKYLSETYAELLDTDRFDDPDWNPSKDGKSAMWKLAIYWATQRRFWSPSRTIERDIELDEDRTDIRRGVADATATSLDVQAREAYQYHASYPAYEDTYADDVLATLSRDLVAQMDLRAHDAGQSQTTLANIDFLGTYHRDDLPARPEKTITPDIAAAAADPQTEEITLASTGDRPPPINTVW